MSLPVASRSHLKAKMNTQSIDAHQAARNILYIDAHKPVRNNYLEMAITVPVISFIYKRPSACLY